MACATTVNVPNCLLGSKPKSLVSRFYRRPTAKATLNCGEKDGAETASGVLEEADLTESGDMIFLTVSKPRMSTQVRLVRAIPRIYLVCALHANAVAAKPRI